MSSHASAPPSAAAPVSAPAPATAAAPQPEYGGPHPWQIQPWARVVRRCMRWRAYTRWVDRYCKPLTVRGVEHFDGIAGPCIVIANHQSHMDTLVLYTALPERIKRDLYFGAAADRWYVKGKKKLVLQPWYQSLVLGNFPIRRGGGSAALDYAKWLLGKGRHIGIFPEGTRATSDALGQFRAGVAMLALEHGVPVVPAYLSGLREMRPKGQREVVPGPATAEFLEPVRFAPGTSVAEATQILWERMNAKHLEHHPEPAIRRAA
jgi:1-acyl-sn-glycerol-3-phosphate acyltransferase